MDGKCAKCSITQDKKLCRNDEGEGIGPEYCCTKLYPEASKNAIMEYEKIGVSEFAKQALLQEAACYAACPEDPKKRIPTKPRILEICEFCHRMGYKRIGLAFCAGLRREAPIVHDIFTAHGLEVISVVCKVGGVDKTRIGLKEEEKIFPGGHESMCNPIGQAEVLNEAGTEFNVLLGLCVGHDSLFMKYSNALCTVLAVKDRLLGHNPLAAVYCSYSNYSYLK